MMQIWPRFHNWGWNHQLEKVRAMVFFKSKFYGSQIHRLLRARADPSAANAWEPRAMRGVAEDMALQNHFV